MGTMIEYALRSAVVGVGLQWTVLNMVDLGLPRRKKKWWFLVALVCKTFLLGFCSNALSAYAPDSHFWVTMYKLLDFVIGIGVNLLFIYIWEGEPLHILLIYIVSEAITMILHVVVIGINRLEGRQNVMEINGPFMAADLLIPIIIAVLFYLLRSQLKRFMHFIGNLYLPFRTLLWVVMIVQFFGTRASSLLYNNTGAKAEMVIMVDCTIQLVLLAIIVFQLVLHQIQTQRNEEMFLDMQMRLLRQRAVLTQQKRSELIENRTLIRQQMKTIEEKIGEGVRIQPEELRSYIDEIQQTEAWKYRGTYCQDILVDEVLAQSRDANQKQGRHLSILLHDYQRGNIAEEDIARLIYCLVYREENTTSNKRSRREARSGYSSESAFESRLVLAGTDGQFAIRYEAPIIRYTRSRIAAMQALVRKYHGELVFTEKTDKNGNKNAYVALHYNG